MALGMVVILVPAAIRFTNLKATVRIETASKRALCGVGVTRTERPESVTSGTIAGWRNWWKQFDGPLYC
jgi:hypothetical protein